MTAVLDASALLAYLQQEPGKDRVSRVLARSVISTVNWAEVIGKSIGAGVETEGLLEDLGTLGLKVVPFTATQAELAGSLAIPGKALGLSLGDRACLALGIDRGKAVYTADRSWSRLDDQITVETIR